MPKGVFLMNMSKKEYNAYVQRLAPKSPIWKDLLNAFWTGGLICVLGQLIAKCAGAGTLVPITGFANSVVSPAMEYRSEGLVTGMAAKMFTIAGPVIVYGTVASVLYGVIYWLCTAL